MISLPEEYIKRMKCLLGDEYDSYIASVEKEAVKAFRVNTEKISLEDFEKINPFPREKIPYVENGYYFTLEKPGNHPLHHAGAIYVQEPGAMAPAEITELGADWTILDMCAAPGGKSTQLRNKLGERGILVSNEIVPSRCKILTGNIERLGLKNTVTTCLSSEKIAEYFPRSFDLICVDAPCSGEGMFRKQETAVYEWSVENVKKCALRQREILENAVEALREGGYIIYATCTFSLEENEMVVDSFLDAHPEFELCRVKPEVEGATSEGVFFNGCRTKNINYCRRFYPHKSKGEGQFMALLHNKNQPVPKALPPRLQREKVPSEVFDFLDEVLTDYDKSNVLMYNSKPVYFTPDFPLKKGVAFSCGVTIGEIKKGYIQPHHQFFMAMGKSFRRQLDLTNKEEELKKYLRGEEICADCEKGWAVVTFEGCSTGGIKVVNGRGKNHYPKGLRLI